jgi:hypothetical protein
MEYLLGELQSVVAVDEVAEFQGGGDLRQGPSQLHLYVGSPSNTTGDQLEITTTTTTSQIFVTVILFMILYPLFHHLLS